MWHKIGAAYTESEVAKRFPQLATFNKLSLVLERVAIYHRQRNSPRRRMFGLLPEVRYLLYLDADAIVTAAGPMVERMVSEAVGGDAVPVLRTDTGGDSWYNINIGVFLWDMASPMSEHLARYWLYESVASIQNPGWPHVDDQQALHWALRKLRDAENLDPQQLVVKLPYGRYNYGHPEPHKAIAHIIRQRGNLWDTRPTADSQRRVAQLKTVAADLSWCN